MLYRYNFLFVILWLKVTEDNYQRWSYLKLASDHGNSLSIYRFLNGMMPI